MSQEGSNFQNIESSQPCTSLNNVSAENTDECMQTDTMTFIDETDNSFHGPLKDPGKSAHVSLISSLWMKLKWIELRLPTMTIFLCRTIYPTLITA